MFDVIYVYISIGIKTQLDVLQELNQCNYILYLVGLHISIARIMSLHIQSLIIYLWDTDLETHTHTHTQAQEHVYTH